jgi:hypothetical protein
MMAVTIVAIATFAGLLIPIVLFILSWLWELLYAFIEDAKVSQRNLYTDLLAKIFGYSRSDEYYYQYRKEGCESRYPYEFFCMSMAVGVGSPSVIYAAIFLYPLTLAILLGTGLVFSARGIRRITKRFQSHLEDKSVHKGGSRGKRAESRAEGETE